MCVLDNPATKDIHSRSFRWYWSTRAGSIPRYPGQAPPHVEGARAGGRKQHPRKARQRRAGHHPAQDRQGAHVPNSIPCTPALDACMPCAPTPPTMSSSACLLPPAVDLLTYFCGGGWFKTGCVYSFCCRLCLFNFLSLRTPRSIQLLTLALCRRRSPGRC